MATHSSIVKPVRWREALLSLCPFVVALALTRLAGLTHPTSTLVALGAYLAYRIAVRFVLCRDHRRGVALARAGRFHEALAAFERSERVWARRRTLDRFRAVLLGSGTPWPFEILARYNQAYALSRLGRGEEALALLTAGSRRTRPCTWHESCATCSWPGARSTARSAKRCADRRARTSS